MPFLNITAIPAELTRKPFRGSGDTIIIASDFWKWERGQAIHAGVGKFSYQSLNPHIPATLLVPEEQREGQ